MTDTEQVARLLTRLQQARDELNLAQQSLWFVVKASGGKVAVHEELLQSHKGSPYQVTVHRDSVAKQFVFEAI